MISPEARAIAERQAAGDIALLERLVAEGKVMRVKPKPAPRVIVGMDTIRPKSKKRRR